MKIGKTKDGTILYINEIEGGWLLECGSDIYDGLQIKPSDYVAIASLFNGVQADGNVIFSNITDAVSCARCFLV